MLGGADIGGPLLQDVAAAVQRAQESIAGPQQTGRDRALEGARRAEVGEPGDDRRRREAVFGERDQHGVQNGTLAIVGQARTQLQGDHLGEPDPPDQLRAQIASAHGH